MSETISKAKTLAREVNPLASHANQMQGYTVALQVRGVMDQDNLIHALQTALQGLPVYDPVMTVKPVYYAKRYPAPERKF